MRNYFTSPYYKKFVYFLILAPNLFVVLLGIESFPFTSAPMFGHYVGEKTELYLLEFEGISGEDKINLKDYYDRPDAHFIRQFFSKVYATHGDISPFHGRIGESPEKFQKRMNLFFEDFALNVEKQNGPPLQRIYLKAQQVSPERELLSEPHVLGYYDIKKNHYTALNEVN